MVEAGHLATLETGGRRLAGAHFFQEGQREQMLVTIARVEGSVRIWRLSGQRGEATECVFESSEAGMASMFSHSFSHHPVGEYKSEAQLVHNAIIAIIR